MSQTTSTTAPIDVSTPVTSPTQMLDLIGDKLMDTERVLRKHLRSDVPFVDDAGQYLAESGGKRMRPALLLLVSRLLGHDSDEEVTYAAVIEFIHTATLVHDDIIDHSDLRRGRETVNSRWGNSLTVLLGDWIYTKAMRMALAHDNLEVIRQLTTATLRMTEGEMLSLERLGAIDLSVDEYFSIVDRKTAHLFSAACSIPCLIHPARPEAAGPLSTYGRALGVCFQLVDDLLDFTASEGELGKPVLSDLKEGKLTLPLLLLLPRVGTGQRKLIQNVLEDRAFQRVAAQDILDLVRIEGTLEEVESLARQFASEASEALSFFPPSEARNALELAPEFVLNRRS